MRTLPALASTALALACQSEAPPPAECAVTADCPGTDLCVDAGCIPRPPTCCVFDAECPDGFACRECGCFPRCEDFDRDGVFAIGCPTALEVDCNDADPEVFPGAEEICGDRIDQNCVDGPDEARFCSECAMIGMRECGVADCSGLQRCDENGRWGECVPFVPPRAEICGNDRDDDCNGVIDDC